MSEKRDTIELMMSASDFVQESEPDEYEYIADLLLRNPAVLADRLEPFQASELGKPAINALLDVVSVAQEIRPSTKEEMRKFPNETRAEHSYRVNVWQPLRLLQAAVSRGEYKSNPEGVATVRRAVHLGSIAFKEIINDPVAKQSRVVQHAAGYFHSNAEAAATRASRLRAQRVRS
jgi:hypothetical protein